jgi:hypothetical protein
LSACLYRESLTGLTDTTLSQVPPGCLTDLILHLPLAGVFFACESVLADCGHKKAGQARLYQV